MELEIGKNYGGFFGLDSEKSQRLVYLGDDNWRAEKAGESKEISSAPTTAEAVRRVSEPTAHMGM